MNTPAPATMELRWIASLSASCLHAAEAVAHGQLVADTQMAETIAEPAQALRQKIVAAGLPRTAFLRHVTGLAAITGGARQLAEVALVKTIGADRAGGAVSEISAAILELERSVREEFPNMVDELSLRIRPIREQWEARGPGLLRRIARWTDPRLIAPRADVVLVHPSLGGGGSAHLPYNNVLLEAVLANPVAQLPETLRLAWLLAQLNLDLPIFSETIHAKRLPHVAELAMIPVTLKAAEELDMLEFSPELVNVALNAWHVVTPPDVEPVDVLCRWWNTYLETRPRWDVGLTALDRMFG